MRRKRSWIKRVALWSAAVVGSVLLLQSPRVIHEWRMKRQVEQMLAAMHQALGPSPNMAQTTSYLSAQSFNFEIYNSWRHLNVTRGLSSGTPFWDALSAHIHMEFDESGPLIRTEIDLWPYAAPGFRSSQFDAIVPNLGGLIWFLVLLWMLIKRERRALRWNRNQCIECGYPVGTIGDACPECGASLAESRPRMLQSSQRSA